ncbi:uncharacterized protein LOC125533651 [Triticum urartu]|uniref:uncharacterized protein LOC125533651 n=1 Tax=Triticum urartu TaxID=4572 RepID=UPI002043F2D2|nr:uncharacterized protein LOC125533651 [Triticum urartu]
MAKSTGYAQRPEGMWRIEQRVAAPLLESWLPCSAGRRRSSQEEERQRVAISVLCTTDVQFLLCPRCHRECPDMAKVPPEAAPTLHICPASPPFWSVLSASPFIFLAEMLLTPPSFDREVVAGALDRCSYRVKDDVSFLEAISSLVFRNQ